MSDQNTLRNAVLGAIVTILLSFTTISPLLGGGLAGYLQKASPKRGAKVGAISGAMASIPFLLVIFLGLSLFFGGVAGMGGNAGVPGGMGLLVVLIIVPLGFAWNVGLSAIGGYVGASLGVDSRPPANESAGHRA